MLGTEYSWLITTSAPADGLPRVRLASTGLTTLAVAIFCLVCVSLNAAPSPRELLREATAATKAGDTNTVIAKLEAALALRPDYPRVLNNLARAYARAGKLDEAMTQLREMAAMGLRLDVVRDETFAPLRERADFPALVQGFSVNDATTGHVSTAANLADMTGIVEGFAIHPTTTATYFSDVHNRCIWYCEKRSEHASVKKFSTDADALLGVFALKIDANRNLLWASSSALPEMKTYTAADRGKALLAAYALDSRRLIRTAALPADAREHVLGDFVIASDGSIYATDSSAPVIWRLAPDGTALEKWLESDEFVSLQGIVFGPGGRELYVSDYANGLWRIDLATRTPRLLAAPAHTTLFGIDGIYAVPGGLIAVQNGINPQRVIRIALAEDGSPSSVKMLFAGDAASDFALGQVVDSHFDFVGNSGWSLFESAKTEPAPRTVKIFSLPLE